MSKQATIWAMVLLWLHILGIPIWLAYLDTNKHKCIEYQYSSGCNNMKALAVIWEAVVIYNIARKVME